MDGLISCIFCLQISALTFNGSTTLLASAQSGSNSVVRLWDYSAGTCLSMFRAHAHSLSCLRWVQTWTASASASFIFLSLTSFCPEVSPMEAASSVAWGKTDTIKRWAGCCLFLQLVKAARKNKLTLLTAASSAWLLQKGLKILDYCYLSNHQRASPHNEWELSRN